MRVAGVVNRQTDLVVGGYVVDFVVGKERKRIAEVVRTDLLVVVTIVVVVAVGGVKPHHHQKNLVVVVVVFVVAEKANRTHPQTNPVAAFVTGE